CIHSLRERGRMDTWAEFVEDLTKYSEGEEWLEFKENWVEPAVLGEYISALSNAAAMEGRGSAYFVWGVKDKGHDVVGTGFLWQRSVGGEPLEHWLARQVQPDIGFRFHEAAVRDQRVVVLDIPAARVAPTSFAGERWIRIGSSKERLSKYPERESQLFDVLRHGLPTVENTPSSYQDLTFARLFTYYAGRGIELRTQTFRKNLKLLTEDGRYNLLAQLLSDDSRIPIRFSVFSGTTKAAPLFTVREFGNSCLLVSIDKVLEYGDVLNVPQADEHGRVVERKEVSLFDADAWREAVINAFVHNQWTTGIGPSFTAFSDRIEILSRGTLAPEQTVEGFFAGESVPVNKALAERILQLHISEGSGRGVPKIVERYGRESIDLREKSICVTLPFERVGAARQPSLMQEQGLRGEPLSANRQRILSIMRDNPSVSQSELATIVGISRNAITKNIAWLKKQGFVERVGLPKTGWWKVL
ncbi:MAG: putative DNA binding domain-containing protein, partial [Coriobacteriales bacterium]|nr:putative DNA binding domain-containing protein [Coriobacteriales bacterium]